MPTIGIDNLIGADIYAKNDVDVLDFRFRKVRTLNKGAYIGNMFSYYVDKNTGKIYMMFYISPYDFLAQNPSYIEYKQEQINVPAAKDIKDKIAAKEEEKKKNEMGALSYYIEKYVPYIIGAIAISLVLPSISNVIKRK